MGLGLRVLSYTLTHQNLLFCRVPIKPILRFIIRTYKKVGFGRLSYRALGFRMRVSGCRVSDYWVRSLGSSFFRGSLGRILRDLRGSTLGIQMLKRWNVRAL